jgi:hypothetical protein
MNMVTQSKVYQDRKFSSKKIQKFQKSKISILHQLTTRIVKSQLEAKNTALTQLQTKYDSLLKIYKKTREDLFNFSRSLATLTSEFDLKMKKLSEEAKHKLGRK